jgi:CRISPR/Cas system-associated protein Cas10 (large subunit of type III CRISPR-Cas system)
MDTPEQKGLLLYTFLHDIDAFLGQEKTAEFSQELKGLFSEIDKDDFLQAGKGKFATALKDIGEPDRLPQLPETLTSIFSKVSLKEDTKSAPHNFPRRILRFDKSFLNKEDEDLETMRKEFLKEAHRIPNGDFRSTYETLVSLVEKYTAFFPAPHQALDGVSLFDHLRLSAAMAAYLEKSSSASPPYRVVAGELLGLEDFIYNIATPEGHRGQAKGLRGRSFYYGYGSPF